MNWTCEKKRTKTRDKDDDDGFVVVVVIVVFFSVCLNYNYLLWMCEYVSMCRIFFFKKRDRLVM